MVVEKFVEIAPKDEVRKKSWRGHKLQFHCLLSAYMSSLSTEEVEEGNGI